MTRPEPYHPSGERRLNARVLHGRRCQHAGTFAFEVGAAKTRQRRSDEREWVVVANLRRVLRRRKHPAREMPGGLADPGVPKTGSLGRQNKTPRETLKTQNYMLLRSMYSSIIVDVTGVFEGGSQDKTLKKKKSVQGGGQPTKGVRPCQTRPTHVHACTVLYIPRPKVPSEVVSKAEREIKRTNYSLPGSTYFSLGIDRNLPLAPFYSACNA